MMLSGNLSNWSVPDLIQIMRVTGKTASLRIDGARSGVIHFREGDIAGADLGGRGTPSDPDSAWQAMVDAVFVLQAQTEGSFFVGEPQIGGSGPTWGVAEVLSEVERLAHLEQEIHRMGVGDSTPMRLAGSGGSSVTLSADDWGAVAALTRTFSLRALEQSMGRTRALQVLIALVSRGLIERAEGELEPAEATEPSPWFEQPRREPIDLTPDLAIADMHFPAEGDEDEMEEGGRRRHVKGRSSSPSTTLIPGVMDDMRRLRTSSPST
jgi:hypothetical protein